MPLNACHTALLGSSSGLTCGEAGMVGLERMAAVGIMCPLQCIRSLVVTTSSGDHASLSEQVLSPFLCRRCSGPILL